MYHDKATPWLRRRVSDQGRKATSVETSRKTPICIHLFTHLSILHSFIQLTNLSECTFVFLSWSSGLFVWYGWNSYFCRNSSSLIDPQSMLHWTMHFLPENLEELYMGTGQAESSANAFPVQQYVPRVPRSLLATPPIHDLCTTCLCKGSSNQRSHSLTMRAHSYILVEWASLFTCEWTLCCIPWGVSLIQ